MSRIPSCTLTSTRLTEEYILSLEAFLNIYPLTPFEAQIILAVSRYPDHHVDIDTLAKRIPHEFFKDPGNDVEKSVKSLMKNGYLQPYEGKKEVLCVLCTSWGRDVARQIMGSCFSEALKFYDEEKQKIDARRRRLCVDPLGLETNEKRYANGPKGKIEITIDGIFCSDQVFSTTDNRVEYERRVVARAKCPRCKNSIQIEYCFNPTTVWQKYLEQKCEKCSYSFCLSFSLMKYYEPSTSEI